MGGISFSVNYQTRVIEARDDSLFVAEEFDRMVELGAFENMRAELVRGRIERMSPAAGGHASSNFDVAYRIRRAFGELQVHVGTDLTVGIDTLTTRALDIAIATTMFNPRSATPAFALLLGVEIADTTLAKDLGDKARDYARGGLSNYWVVDLRSHVVHTFEQPNEDGYGASRVVRFGEPLAVPGTDKTITID